MSDTLSREQVERSIGMLDAWLGQEGDGVLLGDLLKHDAEQRAKIAALEQEHAGCKASLRHILLDNDKVHAQLTTLTAERDRLREDAVKDKESFYRRVAHEIDSAMERVKVRRVIARGEAYDEQLQIVASYDGVIIVRMTSAALRGDGG